ncbi:MAG: M20/M25/M40 family metallo-hydrolase [Candidatus Syntropharchaeia archaeon]
MNPIDLLKELIRIPTYEDTYERDGKIFGRGSCDAKGSVVCMLTAALDMKEKIKGTLILNFVSDEEGGGKLGTEFLCKMGISDDVDFSVVGEPTDTYGIVTGQKGIEKIILRTKGVSGHASTPSLG